MGRATRSNATLCCGLDLAQRCNALLRERVAPAVLHPLLGPLQQGTGAWSGAVKLPRCSSTRRHCDHRLSAPAGVTSGNVRRFHRQDRASTPQALPGPAGEKAPLRRVVRIGACRLESRWGPLLHALAQALPSSGDRADSVDFRIRSEREGGSMSPCGVVQWFDPDRAIGLISQEGAGPNVQAEASAVHGKECYLRPGEEVFFDVTLDSAGLRADNIHRPPGRETQPLHRSNTVTL
ncbi:cold-shock protein [Streptomyces subrutilus]|uniref:cold-shock protein n=1 Tax=Streptomyces subrutilus TaxID=36818 RepID=UPI003D769108